ncbi:PAX-interacting protein 1-like [Engraulis encrasicolus]|uniref:PAX-interacting protein 1-like n=1 Tax=Engraulis encrasicolus TaxID=184585 RepID=UPI002FD56E21
MGGEEEVNVEVEDPDQKDVSDASLSSGDEQDGNLESSMEDESAADQSLARKKPKATVASGYQRALQNWSADQRTFLEEMQHSQLQKVEALQQKAREHEERMFMAFMEENTRSNERLLTHLFEGLRGMLSPTPAQGFPPPHAHPHLYPHPMMPHPYPPLHTPTTSNAYPQARTPPYPQAQTPDYVLHDLDVDN